MKQHKLTISEGINSVKLLETAADLLNILVRAKDVGLKEVFYQDEYLYLGKEEYVTDIFQMLDDLGYECELDCTFIGSGIYIREKSDD
tara:strand:+ start:460 stop:723 length:264 start_codon:yes stop_codon:yes gene_type:complete